MYIVLEKHRPWEQSGIVYERAAQRPYDHFSENGVEVFIYGHPYHATRISWLSAREVHQMFTQRSAEFVHDIEGSYGIIILDRARTKCYAIVDRYKIFTFFWTRDQDTMVIADSIMELARHVPRLTLNQRAFLELAHFGFILGEKTLVEGISSLEPATVHIVDAQLGVEKITYWRFADGKKARASKEELLDRFNSHVSHCFKLGDRIGVTLTGGLDTRAVLSACVSQEAHRNLRCITHGTKGSSDVRIARKICRRLNLAHHLVLIDQEAISEIPKMAERLAGESNGLLSFFKHAHLWLYSVQGNGLGDALLCGYGGELLRCFWVSEGLLKADGPTEYSDALRRKLDHKVPRDVYRGFTPEEVTEVLNSSVLDEVKKAGLEDPIVLAEHLYLRHRIGNFMGETLRYFGRYARLFHPFLERNMLQLIPHLDRTAKLQGDLIRYIICSNSPLLASLLLDTGKAVNTENRAVALKSWLARSLSAWTKKVSNRLATDLLKLAPGSRLDYKSWLREHHSAYLLNVLDYDQMLLKDALVKEKLEAVVSGFLRGESLIRLDWYWLTGILSAELSFRALRTHAGQASEGLRNAVVPTSSDAPE